MSSRDVLDERTAQAVAALLDLAPDEYTAGSDLPMMWHLFFFLDHPAQRDLGSDGHPKGATPTPAGMRRMFAGGAVTSLRALRIGDSAESTTVLVGDQIRQGKSGTLRFLKFRTEVFVNGYLALIDERDIVYIPLDQVPAPQHRLPSQDPVPEPQARLAVRVDPTLLFRFSALTYNAHRIHYDRDYARDVEGYPGLVVHGPLQALLMAELARRHRAGRSRSAKWEFQYRLRAPLFEQDGLQISLHEHGTELQLQIAAADGRVTATASQRWK